MAQQELIIFKLKYSGDVETCENIGEEIYDLFSLVDILAFYVGSEKRLYIWVGNNASRMLKNYIILFRELFAKDYPNLRVLRYFTVESKSETFNFFEDTQLSKELVHARIEAHENKLLPFLSEIKDLEEEASAYFEGEEYDNAIEASNKIIELAKKIDDTHLERDQKEFIAEAESRAKVKKILEEIMSETNKINDLFKYYEGDENIINIHEYVLEFKTKYGESMDLASVPEVQEMLYKERELWNKFNKDQEIEVKREDLLEIISNLRKEGKSAIEKGDLAIAFNVFKEIINYLTESID